MMGAVSLGVLTIESSGLIGLKAQGLRLEHFEASGSMDLGIGLSGEVERSKALQPPLPSALHDPAGFSVWEVGV